MHACVCVFVVGVCVCGSGMLICFVSALGSHEMGRHKLPIIIIIIIIKLSRPQLTYIYTAQFTCLVIVCLYICLAVYVS